MIDGLLDSPLIEVRTGVDVSQNDLDGWMRDVGSDAVVLTCPLDAFTSGHLGELEWRGILVRNVHIPYREDAQGAMVVNYPGAEFSFIRVHETKHASGQSASSSPAPEPATTPSRPPATGSSTTGIKTTDAPRSAPTACSSPDA